MRYRHHHRSDPLLPLLAPLSPAWTFADRVYRAGAGLERLLTEQWGGPLWRVIGGFFTDPRTRVWAWALVVVLTLLSLLGVRLSVLFSYWSNDLYTSLQTAAEGIATGGPSASACHKAIALD